MRWILAETLDHACVPSRLSPFYYLSPLSHHPSLLLPPTLLCVRFSFSVLFLSSPDFVVLRPRCFSLLVSCLSLSHLSLYVSGSNTLSSSFPVLHLLAFSLRLADSTSQ